MDVDVGLALGLLDEGRYQELSERLRRAGFGPDANESGRRTRQRWVWKDSRGVSVDFLIPLSTPADRGGTIRDLEEDFAALIAPGLPLAFRDRTKVTLDGETLLEERAVREMWVCGPAAYLVLRLLGATIVARHAGDMIGELTLAMTAGVGLGTIARTIHPYPTQAEAIKKVADKYNHTRLTPRVKSLMTRFLAWRR